MSVPRGKMDLDLSFYDVELLQRVLMLSLSDYPYPGEHLAIRLRPLLLKVNLFMEAIEADG